MHERQAVTIAPEEILRQEEFMAQVAAHPCRPLSYHIVTFGCQMNAHDSENLAGMLTHMGLTEAAEKENADFVIYNTCCVRDNAERKALGNVTWLKELKKEKPDLMIGVCGCMIQQPGMADKILKQYKFVDLAFGTHNLYRFPELFMQALETRRPVIEVMDVDGSIAEELPVKRLNPYHAYINIMYGCNNFCSYCIVPYVRGRERSRTPEAIIEEAKALRDSGVQEIMLLGQNVNSYDGGITFAQLLKRLDEVGIPRIRFMTSHPKDLSQELIDVIASGKHICHQFHLPVQAGNDEILHAMNRHYTRASYLEKVTALRKAVPDIGLTTDLIVGFPGETEEQFQDTLSLVEEVGYDAAFTFIYSPRVGTKAACMPGQVDAKVSQDRILRLIALQEKMTAKANQAMLGKTEQVLVEGLSKRDKTMVSGKGLRGITISFPGSSEDVGKIIAVKVTSCGVNTLRGERI
ncbi:MAG: tRNA (N6-isopentenyl adenosine(37)-C2)-methylthiotransferase MiaB [Clostridia bacterium]|nr:tRNA (N6-isopentenyl adenosine(37)-C2)-methylthiotransferase MiaB [Clostridia bacterium]